MKRALVLALCGCGSAAQPTLTGTLCPDPDPMTYGYTAAETPGYTGSAGDCNFGHDFMFKYCTNCHSSDLPRSLRNGATLFHDFDSLYGVMEIAVAPTDHIDEQAGFGPKAHNTLMPGGGTAGKCPSVPGGMLDEDCPEPTDQERTELSQWLACERLRSHDLADAGVPLDSN